MKFYTITGVSNFLERPLIREFHAVMFHGLAERDGQEYPHDTSVWASTESASLLQISRTIHHIPDVSAPSTHLVVSERVANRLRSLQHVRLMPVAFKRFVEVNWRKGDMSWFEEWGGGDPCELLRTQPDISAFHHGIGNYYEVQTYRWRDIVDQYPTASEIEIEESTPPMQQTERIRVSSQMMIDYPIFWWGSVIVNHEVFDLLDPFIDRDFFMVRKYEVI